MVSSGIAQALLMLILCQMTCHIFGQSLRLLHGQSNFLNDNERRLIQDRVDKAAQSTISKAIWHNGALYWTYIAPPNRFNEDEPDDHVLFGLTTPSFGKRR